MYLLYMDAIISDTTMKTVRKDQSYYLKVFSRGNRTMLEIDSEMIPEIESLLKLAVQNGRVWQIWNKELKVYVNA